MEYYEITYIGIGGLTCTATIEAYTPYGAREEFEKSYWSHHEILSVKPIVRPIN